MLKATNKPPRLKKDGTIDRRNGNPGNRGNRYATGRKHIEGQEVRKHISFMATEKEYRLLLMYANILKADFSRGAAIAGKLGTPPPGRAKKDGSREKHVIRVYEKEKQLVKNVLSIIKDRYETSYIAITAG